MAQGTKRHPKRPSRARGREQALAAARAVEVPAACDVCVVGGGAAGLAAAITAAEAGAQVVVFERDLSCGRTILATGNGRCNFCNVRLDPARYNRAEFVAEVCGERWLDDVLGFFRESGLRWALEDDRLYPISRQAASVRNVLLARARHAGVVLASARTVERMKALRARENPSGSALTDAQAGGPPPAPEACEADGSASHQKSGWRVSWRGVWDGAEAEELAARSVVLAVGGGCIADFAGSLGLSLVPEKPVLTPLACEDSPLAALDGRRAQVAATLYRGHLPIRRERGEALLRGYGLSGIVIFDLSRTAEPGDVIALDLAPDVSASELARIIAEARIVEGPRTDAGRADRHSDSVGADSSGHGTSGCDRDSTYTSHTTYMSDLPNGALDGVLDPAIAAVVERLARERWQLPGDERMDANVPATDAEAAVALAKGLPFRVTGAAHPEQAQVTRGGIDVSCLDATTLAVRNLPGLHACGEAMDVDGDCGGFNLAWAWKSGMVAGTAATGASR